MKRTEERIRAGLLGAILVAASAWYWLQAGETGVVVTVVSLAGVTIGVLIGALRPVTGSLDRTMLLIKAIVAVLAVTTLVIGVIYTVLGVTLHTFAFYGISVGALVLLRWDRPWERYRRYVERRREA